MKLAGVMVGTDDSKKLGEFYTKIFGKPGWDQDGWYGFDVDGGSLMVGPHSEVKGMNTSPARIMICLVTDDVAKDFKRLKDLGAKVVAEPYEPDKDANPDTWLATLADPDGNYLQLSSPW